MIREELVLETFEEGHLSSLENVVNRRIEEIREKYPNEHSIKTLTVRHYTNEDGFVYFYAAFGWSKIVKVPVNDDVDNDNNGEQKQ